MKKKGKGNGKGREGLIFPPQEKGKGKVQFSSLGEEGKGREKGKEGKREGKREGKGKSEEGKRKG